MKPRVVALKPTKLKLTEADVALACIQLLEWDGWRHLKTDPCSDRARGKGFGEKGMADSLFIRYRLPVTSVAPLMPGIEFRSLGSVLWVEFKRPKGGRLAPHQRLWHESERKRGALTWIAGVDFEPTFEAFKHHYHMSGLQRRV